MTTQPKAREAKDHGAASMRAPRSICHDLLRAMVRIDSVTSAVSGRPDAEAELADALEQWATGMGLRTQRLPIAGRAGNLLVTVEGATSRPWLLFQSHLDTVGVGGMTVDPFAAEVCDGRLYGRGACDTKASGAAMLMALLRYARAAERPNSVAVLFSTDEEVGKAGITAFLHDHLPQLGWTLGGCIVGEPTGLRPVVAHNGVVRWAIRTAGVAAHSSDPSRGRSAIRAMDAVMEALETRYIARLAARHPLTGPAVCSINLIRGGSQINVIPDACEIELDRRLVPGERADSVLPAVERVLEELRRETPTLEVTQGEAFTDPPLDPALSESWIRRVTSVLGQLGLDATPVGAPYGTDAGLLHAADRPTVVLGPGDIAQAHTADEWVALEEVDRAVNVCFALMCEGGCDG